MFKPMLAPREVPQSFPDYFKKLQYPLLVSPKLDGIRCVIKEGKCKSRTFKDIRSSQVQELFSGLDDYDGELIAGNPCDPDVYLRTDSHVMSFDKPHPEMAYHVFDFTDPGMLDLPFKDRFEILQEVVAGDGHLNVQIVPHTYVNNEEELLTKEEEFLEMGYEGVMLRNPFGKYKCGRATFRENLIYKLKRFEDDEGIIIGFEERQKNTNEQTRDDLGYAKRSKAQEGMVGANTLGKFIVDFHGVTIKVAPGKFKHDSLEYIWNNQEKFLGKPIKFRHFPHGVKDLPRHPRANELEAQGFRDLMDM